MDSADPDPADPELRSHRPRLLPIGWMVLVLSGVLYLAGSNIGSGWVIILTAAMVGAVATDVVTVWRVHRRTAVIPTLPATATTTEPTIIRTTLRRPDLGTSVQLSDPTAALRTVVRRGSATVEAPTVMTRGHHRQVVVHARTTGPLGLAHAAGVHTAPASLWCRPGTLPAGGGLRALLGTQGDADTSHLRRGEEEVRGVREFTPTDPRRSVHWRATARQGRLMVRELDSTSGARLRLGIAGSTWTAPVLDLACQVVASIAEEAGRQGHLVEVVVDGAAHAWDEGTWHLLAGLPPAAGIPPRPLAHRDERAVLWLAPPAGGGAIAGLLVGDRHLADIEEVEGWLRGPG